MPRRSEPGEPRTSMQFRTRTLLVLVATSALALTLSAGLPLEVRIALNIAVLGIWLGLALFAQALRARPRRRRDTLAIWLGLALTSLAISGTAVLMGVALHARWHRENTGATGFFPENHGPSIVAGSAARRAPAAAACRPLI
jgi:hypothetical protein